MEKVSGERSGLHPFGHGGDVATAAAQAGIAAAELLDFSASINPLGPPEGLFPFLAESLPQVTAYPDPACRSLLAAISRRYATNAGVVAGNGAGELIYLVMRALPPGAVLLAAPTFSLYARAAEAAGRTVLYHTTAAADGFALDVQRYCDRIRRERPALTVLCNPNNPTGTLLCREEVLAVAAACGEAGGHLLVDEAFLEFCPDWRERTLLCSMPPQALVLCSLTKMYAIPGLRLGFLAANPSLAAEVNRLRDPWSVSTLAQLAGEYVLRDVSFVCRTVAEVGRLSGELAQALQKLPGIRVLPWSVNYLFVESLQLSSNRLQERLLAEKVLVRDCGNFHGLEPRYFRVAVRTGEENRRLVSALSKILSAGGNDEAYLDSSR